MINSTLGMFGEYTREERGAAGGCFGASAGAFGGLVVVMIIYLMARKGQKLRIRRDRSNIHESKRALLKQIAIIAIPITLGATITPIMNLIDTSVITGRLMESGWSRFDAENMYGQLMGFANPVIQFPQVLMQAIVISLVPMVAAANSLGNRKELHYNISLGMRMTTLIAIPASVGLWVLAEPTLTMLYSAQKEAAVAAAPCLQALAASFIFVASITTITGALQGIGKQVVPVINLVVGVFVKFIITWILVGIPSLNILGAVIGSGCAYFVTALLDLLALRRFTGVRMSASQIIIKPLISSLVMGVIVMLSYKGILAVLGSNGTATVLSIFIGVAVYGLMVIRTKTINREELMSVPAGRRLALICDKLRLW